MKKWISLLCLGAALCLSACAAASDSQQSQGSTAGAVPSATMDAQEQADFQQLEVVNNDQCAIYITGLDVDSFWDCVLQVSLENKSQDASYMISVSEAAINGVQADPFFATEVAPGKKSNQKIIFSDPFPLEIGEYTDIQLTFRVYDSEDLMAAPVAEPTVHIYPRGQGNAQPYTRQRQPSDTVLVENDRLTVLVTGYHRDDIWGYTADLYLENRGEETVVVSVEDVSINGYMVEPFFASQVSGGKCAFASISWPDSALEENGIDQVEEIQLILRAWLQEDWLAEDLVRQAVTLSPEVR